MFTLTQNVEMEAATDTLYTTDGTLERKTIVQVDVHMVKPREVRAGAQGESRRCER